jgi:AraC-like DNA-binding protein
VFSLGIRHIPWGGPSRITEVVLKEGTLALDWNGDSDGRADWLDQMAVQAGMAGQVDATRPNGARIRGWQLGSIGVVQARMSGICLSPVRDGARALHEEFLYLKILTQGSLGLTQHGETVSMAAGTAVLIDPAWAFEEHFGDRAALTVMRIPRQALRARGLQHALSRPVIPDVQRADPAAVRDFLLSVAGLGARPGAALRRQLGEQCLDLLGVLLEDGRGRCLPRGPEATLLRAKRAIARRIGDPDLTIGGLAAELNVSSNYLGRLFKRDGTSVMRYVGAARLERAARLLRTVPERPMQIQEIAYQCGYVSLAHFSRAYKQRFGMSPRAAVDAAARGTLAPA